MINHDSQLKLQAFLDGELSAREAEEVQRWLAKDQEAQLLLAELQNTNASLVGYEAEIKLPESREFFWSRIQREIERQTPAPVSKPSFSLAGWLQRHLVPASGLGVALLAILLVVQLHPASASQLGEMELSSNDMGAVTFRNQEEKVTVVWLYDRSDSEFTDPAVFASIDPNE
jgi:anti-sigma factor RsiW